MARLLGPLSIFGPGIDYSRIRADFFFWRTRALLSSPKGSIKSKKAQIFLQEGNMLKFFAFSGKG